jgi:hypothetical protein
VRGDRGLGRATHRRRGREGGGDGKADPRVLALEQAWKHFLSGYATPALDDEPESAELLGWGLQATSAELPAGLNVGTTPDNRFIETEVHLPNGAIEKMLVAVCDKSARGNGL